MIKKDYESPEFDLLCLSFEHIMDTVKDSLREDYGSEIDDDDRY